VTVVFWKLGGEMNFKRGMLRLWVALSLLWMAGVTFIAFEQFHDLGVFAGDYVRMGQLRDEKAKTDYSKPYKENFFAPGEDGRPDIFVNDDHKFPSDGMQKVEFPDHSVLRLSKEFNKRDMEIASKAFWEQRWRRYATIITPWVAAFLGPPAALLLLGWIVAWITRGFTTPLG
jgi:hypothetical protein